jgi:LEA14-like dessication related protein
MSGIEVLIALGVVAGLYFFNLQRAAGNLVFFPGNITGFSLNGPSPTITAELVVQNTNNISFTIQSVAASVSSNGTLIGNVSNFLPVTVPGNSQAVIPLTLVLQPIALVNNIIGIITGGSGNSQVQIKGSLNADGIQAPISLTYKIGL